MDQLSNIGQSLWLKNITRQHLQSGSLIQYIKEGSITGVSIAPLACSQTLRNTEVYDESIRRRLAVGLYGEALATELILEDACHAADLLRPVFERTDGVDGWVAIAIFPPPERHTVAVVSTIANVWGRTRRPNILITLPGIQEWLTIIGEVIYSGMPVNIAFLYSYDHFLSAAKTCLQAIERRIAAGKNPAVTCLASISISRLAAALSSDLKLTEELRFRGTIALARRIYRESRDLHNSQEWERAYNAGARPLRLIWTMGTSCKKQSSDALINHLLAPLTVALLPEPCLQAATGSDRGRGTPMPPDGGNCDEILFQFSRQGINLDTLAYRLQNTEMTALTGSWIELMEAVAHRSASIANR